MPSAPSLLLSQTDFDSLMSLVQTDRSTATELLEEELTRARVVPPGELPSDVVAMDSTVRYVDESNAKETTVKLVFPRDADVTLGRVSILAPVGSALLGLRPGQRIDWPLPGGRIRTFRVVSVAHGPQATPSSVA